MFGLSKETQIKLKLLQYLDNHESYVNSEKIAEYLGVQYQTMRKYYREINQQLEQIYPEQQFYVEASTRYGTRLYRGEMNLDQISEIILTGTLEYAVFQKFIYERSFSSQAFCDEHGISFSKLRRKITQINQFLHRFDLHISISHQVKINGSEEGIRIMLFLLMYGLQPYTKSVYSDAVEEKYYRIGHLLANELEVEPNNYMVHLLSTWSFIISQSVHLGYNLSKNDRKNKVPLKEELTGWGNKDWELFNSVLYCFELCPNQAVSVKMDTSTKFKAQKWIKFFERHFRILVPAEKNMIYTMFHRLHLIKNYHFLDGELHSLLYPVTVEEAEQKDTAFDRQFQEFWQSYSKNVQDANNFVKCQSYLMCQNFIPLEQTFEKVHIFIYSKVSASSLQLIKNKIYRYFMGEVVIEFVDDFMDADFTVITEEINRTNFNKRQKIVVINPWVSEKDLLMLAVQLQEFLTHAKLA